MAVGDVNSDARGSGARYNDGKPDLSLIPLSIIAQSMDDGSPIATSLNLIGLFQTTGNGDYVIDALNAIRGHWRDAARVFEYGKKKYAAWNWAKGMNWSIPLACAGRHALAILEGEEIDQESGLPHIGHYMANLVMLAHFVRWFPEGNDLPPPELFREPAPSLRADTGLDFSRFNPVVNGPDWPFEGYGTSPIEDAKPDLEVLDRYSDKGVDEVLTASEILGRKPPVCACPLCVDADKVETRIHAKFPPFTL